MQSRIEIPTTTPSVPSIRDKPKSPEINRNISTINPTSPRKISPSKKNVNPLPPALPPENLSLNQDPSSPLEEKFTTSLSTLQPETEQVEIPELQNELKQSVKIVLHVEEVKQKYLLKQKADQTTQDGKNASSIKLVIGKVQDLKNNQQPWANLRKKKNQVLSLNL